MNLLIGIVSYLPNDETIRKERSTLIKNLVSKCKTCFPNTPIYIIAQNWKDFTVENATIFSFDMLGIFGARQKLKEKFIASQYDHLLMLDDDCKLTMDDIDVKLYLQELNEHKDKICAFVNKSLKMCCIPKSIYSKMPSYLNSYVGSYNADELLIFNDMSKIHIMKYPYRQKAVDILNPDAISTSYIDKRLKYLK